MKSILLTTMLCSMLGLLSCSTSVPESLLQKSTTIKGDRFQSQLQNTTWVSVEGLMDMLNGKIGSEKKDSIKVSGLKVLSKSTFRLDGADTSCENLTFEVVLGGEPFRIELMSNQSALLDFEEKDFELLLKDGKNIQQDPDSWFDKIYRLNESEIGDLSLLKTMKIAQTNNATVLDAYNALSKKRGVNNLKVTQITNNWYIEGKMDTTDFFCPITKDDSTRYHIGFFVPSLNQGRHSWHFISDLFADNDDLPFL